MSRGESAAIGSERVAPNGYAYVKIVGEWKLKHHIVAEKTLGRTIDTKIERVTFKDRDRTNFAPDNILVEPKKGITNEAKKARLRSRIEDLQAQLKDIEEEEEAS